MKTRMTLCAGVVATLLVACGGSSAGTDPGHGTETLLVNANIDYEGGAARFDVRVRRAGVQVTDAVVVLVSDLGETTLVFQGEDRYEGSQAGWAEAYELRVDAGEDNLVASIEAPVAAHVTSPAPNVAFDPHLAEGGIVKLEWDGEVAQTVRVKTKDFEWGPAIDERTLDVPATVFEEESQEVELSRRNSTPLAGGAPGSDLEARIDAKTDLIVLNPYQN